MCGIAGIYHYNQSPVDLDRLVKMTRVMRHRGPDEEGYFLNTNDFETFQSEQSCSTLPTVKRIKTVGAGRKGNIGFGHRRLSIIDLSSGQQPLSNEDDSIWICFNGEIYNFLDLKKELISKGHRFKTNSDTETIIHAYEEWGEESVKKFRGMFAFGIWDENRQRLFLARDRVGKKPLYYYHKNGTIVFASEIKAILEAIPDMDRKLDYTAISDYLSLTYIPSPKTIFKNIAKLPAASYAVFENGNIEKHSYWDLDFTPENRISETRMMEELLDILEESTRIRMISEVPLGAFLSGGVDSSAVVAMMASCSSSPVVTNAIAFGEEKYNEAPYAKVVAELFTTNHHEYPVFPQASAIVDVLSWHYDEPFADSSAIPTYYVSKLARQNVTVSLSGDGGDENFAGYTRYVFDQRENTFRRLLPQALQSPVFSFLRGLYPRNTTGSNIFRGKAFVENLARDPVNAYLYNVSVFHDEAKPELMNTDVQKQIKGYQTLDYFRGLYQQAKAEDHLSRIQYLDIKSYMCEDILTKVDRASMAVSLEVRCPLLDHKFMEYAARIPFYKKLVSGKGKHIFKKALERHLPADILYRKKMGFAVPVAEWFRKDIKDYSKKLILNGSATERFFNRSTVEKIWNQHQQGHVNASTRLWTIMMFNLWYNRFGE